MLNKFIIFYASLMFAMCLIVMFLLISVELTNIYMSKQAISLSRNIANDGVLLNNGVNKDAVPETSDNEPVSKLRIATDKNIYKNNENVTIVFMNNGTSTMVQSADSSIVVKTRSDIGKNFEVAFIEHKEGDEWIAIEPVKRCSSDCSSPCSQTTRILPTTQEQFVWEQKLYQCLDGKSIEGDAPTGEYRISSATWDEASRSHRMVMSDVFKISNISKK